MVFPRQRLYDVNHTGFVRSVLSGALNAPRDYNEGELESRFKQVFRDYTGITDLIPLSRGRVAGYFAVKHSLSPKRHKVVMSPFTIFDLVNMVRLAGGKPTFVDSEPGGVHVSCRTLERTLDDETAAVIITHYHSTNREIEYIAELCRVRGVKLIEDCAISLGARMNDRHVGSFGDFALFSFGLFKFVSVYFGGGMAVHETAARAAIETELAAWPRMSARDLAPYVQKALKLSALTQKNVFDLFTFPTFRFGYLRDIEFIKNNAQNDPEPFLRNHFPKEFERRPSLFQLNEFIRQIPALEVNRITRVNNATRYYQNFRSANIGGLPEEPNIRTDCYLNFPIIIPNGRDKFVREMMKSGFDVAIYYYRNCAEIEAFAEYHNKLPIISMFANNMVFFPVYPGVDTDYINRLTKRAIELLQ